METVLLLLLLLPLVVLFILSRPLRMRVRVAQSRASRLTLIDFLALLLQLQLLLVPALAVVRQAGGRSEDMVAMIACCFIAALALTGLGAEAASRANIASWPRRLILQLVLVPGMVADAIFTVICLATVFRQMSGADERTGVLTTLLLLAGTIAGGMFIYFVGTWVCRDSGTERPRVLRIQQASSRP
jgi:hypothetical protein